RGIKDGGILDCLLTAEILIGGLDTDVLDIPHNTEIQLHVAQFTTDEINHEYRFSRHWDVFAKLLSCPALWDITGEMSLVAANLDDAHIILDRHSTVGRAQ